MSGAGSMMMTYVLNSLWQVPLIIFAASIGARLVRPLGPAPEHRVWVGALLSEALLPAMSLLPWEHLNLTWSWHLHGQEVARGSVMVQVGNGVASGGLGFPAAVIGFITWLYAAVTFLLTARFVWRCLRLQELMRSAEPMKLTAAAENAWQRAVRRMAAGRVELVASRRIFAPLTMGIAKSSVLLPAELIPDLPDAELQTVIGHELAHVKRMDFVKNLLYELLALPVSYHPGVWLTRHRLTETREMVCDEMAARVSGPKEYAQSLLKVAGLLLQGKAVRVPYAIGMFDSNTLERRLMKLTAMKQKIGRVRRCVALGACVVLGVAAVTSAIAMRIGVDEKGTSDTHKKAVHSVNVKAEVMQNQIVSKVPPVYPPDAKAARIQGKVVLDAVIGTDGHVENLKVVSGPKELQQSALDAVRQWVYKPFLLNGNPVDVTTTINVTYTLAK